MIKVPKVNNLKIGDCRPIPLPYKKKIIKKGSKVPEKIIQRQCEAYLDLINVERIRIPDSLYRAIYANKSVPLYIKSDISKNIAGLPDLMIPKLNKNGVLLLSVEIKTDVGRIGIKQIKWQKILDTQIVRSFEEFKIIVDDFLNEGK